MFETATLLSFNVFLGIHIVFSTLLAWLGSGVLHRRYPKQHREIIAFLVFFNLALPLIGYLFTLWLCYYLINVRHEKVLKHTKSINLEELDQDFPKVKRAFGEGSMIDLMANTKAPLELRMKALNTMAENMTQKNVSVIKNSLSEKDDEIRLYSFSLINNMEYGINKKIHEVSLALKKAKSESEQANAARELAFLYWEMIYFDLSDDVLKNYLMEESYKYAMIAFHFNMSDTQINILLGKIYLAKERYEDAATQFVMAIESGVDYSYIVPYLAELYFKRGNFRSIRSMLSQVKNLGMSTTMHPVVAQWRAHG